MNARPSILLRASGALTGAGTTAGEADPPLPWSAAGSAASVLFAPSLAGPRHLLVRCADRGAAAVILAGRRPLIVLAAVVVAVPASRLLLGPEHGGAVASGLILLGGTALLSALLLSLHEGAGRRIAAAALALGLLLRVAAAIFLAARGGLPDETGLYHPLAADAAACWQAGGASTLAEHPFAENRGSYLYLLSGTYLLAGPGLLAGRVLGILLGLLAALLAGELARPVGGARAASLAVVLVALAPEQALWSATLSRDTLTTVLVLAALACMARRPGSLFRGTLPAVAVPVALLAWNSFPMAGVLAAVVVVLAGLEALSAAGRRGPGGILLPVLFLAIAGGSLAVVGWRYGAYFTPDLLTVVRRNTVGNAPDFLPGLAFDGPLSLLLFLPLGALFVLFAPWPWAAAGGGRLLYGIGALAGSAVAVLGLVGIGAGLRRRPAAAAPAALFVLVGVALLGILEANSGIVVRHRLPIGAVLAAGAGCLLAGMEELRRA